MGMWLSITWFLSLGTQRVAHTSKVVLETETVISSGQVFPMGVPTCQVLAALGVRILGQLRSAWLEVLVSSGYAAG